MKDVEYQDAWDAIAEQRDRLDRAWVREHTRAAEANRKAFELEHQLRRLDMRLRIMNRSRWHKKYGQQLKGEG